MKIVDSIFAVICGEAVGLVAKDLLGGLGFHLTGLSVFFLLVFLPLIALGCLWLAEVIGRKFLFVFQAAKHVLVGTFATILDLKLFEILAWLFAFIFHEHLLVAKGASFLVITSLKYVGNKYWTFQNFDHYEIHKEITKLVIVDAVGLVINVGAFYFFSRTVGAQFGIAPAIWVKLSVIFSALFSAVWNFSGYKFLVFKK